MVKRRKSLTATTQESCRQFWTSLRGNTPQSSSYTATYLPSRKLSKLDEPDMQDTAGEAGDELISDVLLWTPHMVKLKQGNQLEPTYSSTGMIRGVALRTCQKWWTIGRSGERGSGISVMVARHDDDDDKRTQETHFRFFFCFFLQNDEHKTAELRKGIHLFKIFQCKYFIVLHVHLWICFIVFKILFRLF